MRKVAFLLLVILVLAACPPAWAEDVAPRNGVTVSGIEPVSPDRFTGKLKDLGDMLYSAVSPVADTVAKISLATAGILLVAMLVIAPGLARRAVGAIFAVVIGLCLWYCAPYIVGVIKYLALWLQS